jgi:ribosomal protein S18 acetylase RimI-like enzyme
MAADYQIAEEASDQERVTKDILSEVLLYNASRAGPLRDKKFVLTVRGPDNALLGGLVGVQYWNGMFIDLVWVQERLRGRGIGTELMKRAEAALRSRGGEVLFLSTWSFQAPAFYEKLGYVPFGTLEGMPPNSHRTWYSKRLTDAA